MASTLSPYLSFRGNTREAMAFYQTVFGGKLETHTFEEFHMAQSPQENDLIMHSMLTADNGIVFMAADLPERYPYQPGSTISLSLSGTDEAELRGYFDKLSAGGQVPQPLEKAQWGDYFGMLVDKFGVAWMVNITMPKA